MIKLYNLQKMWKKYQQIKYGQLLRVLPHKNIDSKKEILSELENKKLKSNK